MANKIEIFENTLLKLLIRRGLDADRQNIVLTEGELGYTTDTKKLFIGDGQTQGGIVVGGNKFWGAVPSVTSLVGVISGDVAFSTTNNKLYSYIGGGVADIANWTVVGGVYNSGDNTINISGINNITVGTISAANITSDIIGNSLTLSNTKKETNTNTTIEELANEDKDTRILTYKILLEKFNSKYVDFSSNKKNILKFNNSDYESCYLKQIKNFLNGGENLCSYKDGLKILETVNQIKKK